MDQASDETGNGGCLRFLDISDALAGL